MYRLLLVAFSMLFLAACFPPPDPQSHATSNGERYYLPEGATNIVYKGNRWITFDFEGKHFLFYKSGDRAALTQLISQ